MSKARSAPGKNKARPLELDPGPGKSRPALSSPKDWQAEAEALAAQVAALRDWLSKLPPPGPDGGQQLSAGQVAALRALLDEDS